MSSYLLCIGSTACRSLPVMLTALSCGAASPVENLHVFCLASAGEDLSASASLAEDFSACHRLMEPAGESFLFPSSFTFDSCAPVFRSVQELSEDPDSALLLSALRGKGIPFSCQTDREAVEWSFADLLSRPEDPSVAPFVAWLRGLLETARTEESSRLICLADPCDPFAAGIFFALLPSLRKSPECAALHISLLALAETASPRPESFFPSLSAFLRTVEDRSLLRDSGDLSVSGADAVWLISLPSSMVESKDSFQIAAVSAACVLGEICAAEKDHLPAGFHTRETEGTLSLVALGNRAASFVSFVQASTWLLSDLIPALRAHLSHPARLRSLAPGPRNSVLRQLFPASRMDTGLSDSLNRMESVLKKELSLLLAFLRSLPSSLRLSAESVALWEQAVQACGRYITVASELDTAEAEAHESGLDAVRPVHRVSMADTEEEQLLRRLQDIHLQLENEQHPRAEALSALGGYRSLQVRLDCLRRCRAALEEARKKAALPSENLENLEKLKRDRRVRLLQAAVARCESELDPAAVRAAVSAPPTRKTPLSDPYAGAMLVPESCHALERLLSATGTDSGLSVPPLFAGFPDPDLKLRWKALLVACKDAFPDHPLPFLFARASEICREDLSAHPAMSRSTMPPLPLLPDLVPDAPLCSIRDALSLLAESESQNTGEAETRGLLAMLLLRQYRRRTSEEAPLSCVPCAPGASPVLKYWLDARHAEKVWILSLGEGVNARPFALVLPCRAFLPARRTGTHMALVPSFAVWFDRETGIFSDPCESLGEGDRKLLCELLTAYSDALPGSPESSASPLVSFLRAFLTDLSREREPFSPDRNMKTRLRAVCGLRPLAAYEGSLEKVSCFYEHFLPADPVGSCLTGTEDFPPSPCTEIPEEVLYLYRGVPFAREDSRLLLDRPHAVGEDYTLTRLSEECAVLSDVSDDYRDALAENLRVLLNRYPDALPEIRETARELLEEAEKPLERRDPVFEWPWDPKSPSMLTVLRECLGDSLSESALRPFSDLLAVFPARGLEIIGDSLLSSMCVIPPREVPAASPEPAGVPEAPENPEIPAPPVVSPDAVLPPLSPAFGRFLCALPEGRTLLKPGLLSFARGEGDSFRVELTLDGVFPVRLVRNYAAEEVQYLYAHDIPTVALWPSVPFRPQDWRAYFVYAHCTESFSLSVLPAGGSFSVLDRVSEDRCVSSFPSFPICFALFREDKTAGILPNVLPEPIVEESPPVEVCVDFGSAGTSVVFSSGRSRRPMQGPVMVRTLLNNPAASRDFLRREFLPAVPVSSLLPTVSRLFRNVPGAAPVPFEDGVVLMSSDLQDLLSTPSDAIYTSLKWEEEKGRSGFLCLHQVMLMAALQARSEGASGLSWRFALPDEMAKEGRETLMNLFLTLAENVSRESAYPPPGEGSSVLFACESSALGAYFRFCAPEDTRGGFMVLDLGACTADISLFLRGREQAVRTCQIPLGIHYMLLPSLLRDPDLLSREFGFVQDDAFRADLSLLSKALRAARSDSVSLRRARIALDFFVADHYANLLPLMLRMASSGVPTRLCALMLLYFAYLMMLSGLVLLQLASDPTRNDFLPEHMSLCLSGRGASLLEALPPPLKTSLWHFLSMFRNKKVASLSLLFSAEKKMEIPVGLSLLQEVFSVLPPASAVPASIAVRPAELLPEFLIRFRREFPASAELLFPGFFTNDFYHPFSPMGESVLSASIDHSFPPLETPRPYDSLAAWPGNLLDLLSSS